MSGSSHARLTLTFNEKSKSGFHGFPFYHSIGKSEKGFAKLFPRKVVFVLLIMRVHARPLFLIKNCFSNPFSDFQREGKKGNLRTVISALKSLFRFCV